MVNFKLRLKRFHSQKEQVYHGSFVLIISRTSVTYNYGTDLAAILVECVFTAIPSLFTDPMITSSQVRNSFRKQHSTLTDVF